MFSLLSAMDKEMMVDKGQKMKDRVAMATGQSPGIAQTNENTRGFIYVYINTNTYTDAKTTA